ncbi:alpha/beta fold hydrolase [Rhodobacteraceae bacterium 2CG4]|uniref:Alpha/beta fold hydrolase n=1 Tax=Halovulum marinum TaxID=2662447 RepID=A0A6L5YWH4_9RHOB|nr:alpha/beta hydrolase [Halovulum marinum]MSU88676.1 alpha/beta fold hydrolase [Halovulum marinum]
MLDYDLFDASDGRSLAYSTVNSPKSSKKLPGIVFLGGFRSDMTGTKALFLENWAKRAGRAFLRFDYSGHGASSGAFEDGCIGDWIRDARDIIDALTEGPQILVGSSMGGWIALALCRDWPEKVAGLVGIAAAPDFTEDSMWAGFDDRQREQLMRGGRVEIPSDYDDGPYVITRRLIEDGRAHLLLRDPLPLRCPVRLLHGTADADVEMSVPLRLLQHADCADMQLTLVKNADHRFSAPGPLAEILRAIGDIDAAGES